MTNTMMKIMNDEALTFVTGGDNGDARYEHDNGIQLYHVGESVEVYFSGYHITTVNATVIEVSTTRMIKSWNDWNEIEVPYYLVKYAGGKTEWVTANGIERRK